MFSTHLSKYYLKSTCLYRNSIISFIQTIRLTCCPKQSLLPVSGVVFPYSPHHGRYNLNFDDAVQACIDQGAVVATFEQLYKAWMDGLDWCNAGWLNDSTVQYPITKPREPCGGSQIMPGLRSYGRQNRQSRRFDVFCYTSSIKGTFLLFCLHFLKLLFTVEYLVEHKEQPNRFECNGQLFFFFI